MGGAEHMCANLPAGRSLRNHGPSRGRRVRHAGHGDARRSACGAKRGFCTSVLFLERRLFGAKPAWEWPATFSQFLFSPPATPTPSLRAAAVVFEWPRKPPRSLSGAFGRRWRATSPAGNGVANGENKHSLNGVGHPIAVQRAQQVDANVRNEQGHEDPLYAATGPTAAGASLVAEGKAVSIETPDARRVDASPGSVRIDAVVRRTGTRRYTGCGSRVSPRWFGKAVTGGPVGSKVVLRPTACCLAPASAPAQRRWGTLGFDRPRRRAHCAA